ncbi:alginate O-acetyltransferase AlgF [Alteromonas facilis]|uniref:alginate O-acetyltransferase AlgF n=1 Tax=Alteromonas facilis TaxID=2048004 RepID=UPI000C282B5D|nr:alginate O-acetyltransferase AlgF [Alteromonas facilis]
MRSFKPTIHVIFLVLASLISLRAAAEDEALYGKAPPPDAVFFRVLNLSNQVLDVQLAGLSMIKLEQQALSPYGFASAGKASLLLNNTPLSLPGAANSQYTLVWKGPTSAVQVFEETPFNNKRQARIALYNLTDIQTITLKTIDGKHVIIEGASQPAVAKRDVKAIKIATAVHSSSEQIATSEPLMLVRDAVTSIFAIQSSDTISLLVTQSDQ